MPTGSPVVTFMGPPISPQGRIQLYTPDEWEVFIEEWATTFDPPYVQIKRLGGPGDKGADVAGFKSDRGLQGQWDCFQGKHYASPLNFSSAKVEMLKVLRNVASGDWVMPDGYYFLAPRGCGTKLNVLLSQPDKLQVDFLAELVPGKSLVNGIDADGLEAITDLAAKTDFTVFKSLELIEVVAQHARTGYHAARFATTLAPRPDSEPPPEELGAHEARYVAQLVEVYQERHPEGEIETANVGSHPDVATHFRRQRESFYKAEALRVYARDAVPPGTFDALQDDIHSGVVEVADDTHADGWSRMASVLTQAGALDLGRHTLIQRVDNNDRKGICHQLANDDRLIWVRPAS